MLYQTTESKCLEATYCSSFNSPLTKSSTQIYYWIRLLDVESRHLKSSSNPKIVSRQFEFWCHLYIFILCGWNKQTNKQTGREAQTKLFCLFSQKFPICRKKFRPVQKSCWCKTETFFVLKNSSVKFYFFGQRKKSKWIEKG